MKPQDRKPKKNGKKKGKKKGKSGGNQVFDLKYGGMTIHLSARRLAGYRFQDFVGRMEDTQDISKWTSALRYLLGDQYDEAVESMAQQYGEDFTIEESMEWFKGLLGAIQDPNS